MSDPTDLRPAAAAPRAPASSREIRRVVRAGGLEIDARVRISEISGPEDELARPPLLEGPPPVQSE